MSTMNLATLLVKLKADTGAYKQSLSDAEKQSTSFGKTATKALKGLAVGGFAVATGAAAKFATDSVKEFREFEKASSEVFTLLPDMSSTAMRSMRVDVLDFSQDTGRLTDEVVPALYQALSAGVPEDNVFDFMTVAHEAALGGVTELETAVDGISSVMNAYGSDVISASEASDMMFTAVKGGKTTFDELGTSLFQVVPTAASLGLEFGNVTAALATMTAQGVPTSVATTQLRQLLVELSKEGSNAADTFERVAGASFPDFIKQGGNLYDALQLLQQGASESDTNMRELFGSVEAASAAMILGESGAEKFAAELEAVEQSAGATAEAAATMGMTIDQMVKESEAQLEAFKITAGESLGSLVGQTLQLTGGVRGLTSELQKANALTALQIGLEGIGLSAQEATRYVFAVRSETGQYGDAIEDVGRILSRSDIALQLHAAGIELTGNELRKLINVTEETQMWMEAHPEIMQEATSADRKFTEAQGEVAVATNLVTDAMEEETSVATDFFNLLDEGHESTADLRGEMNRLADTSSGDVEPALMGVAGAANITGDEIAGMMEDTRAAEEATLAYEQAIRQAEDALGSYFQQALSGKSINDDMLEQLLQQAVQMGANTEELRHIAAATGNYSTEQIENAISSANLHSEYEKLTVEYGNNRIGVEQVTEAVRLLQEGQALTAEEALNMAYVLTNEVPAGLGTTEQAAADAGVVIDDMTLAMHEIPDEVTTTITDNDTYDSAIDETNTLIGNLDRLDGRQTRSEHRHYQITIHEERRQDRNTGEGPGFQHGGFTGTGSTTDVAGVVHGQEYVFSAPAVRAVGVDYLDDLHEALRSGDINVNGMGGQSVTNYGGMQFYGVQNPRNFLEELQGMSTGNP